MKTKQYTLQRLALVLTTTLLSVGLLLTGCSNSNDGNDSASDINNNKDTAATKVSTEDGNTVVETEDSEATTAVTTTENINDSDNNNENNIANNEQNVTANKEVSANSETVSKTVSPMAAATKQPSLLTNPTKAGTAENTVKLALDTLYYGDVEKAATYYKVDMENFSEELKNTQFAFQQTVQAVTITDTKYNSDKTRATVTGELRLKEQKQPAPLTYELQKIDGVWKILG